LGLIEAKQRRERAGGLLAVGFPLELLQIDIDRIGYGADGEFAPVAVDYRAARGDGFDLLPLIERGALRVMVMPRHLQPGQTTYNQEHPDEQDGAYPKRAPAGVRRLSTRALGPPSNPLAGQPPGRPAGWLSGRTLSGSFHLHGSRSVLLSAPA